MYTDIMAKPPFFNIFKVPLILFSVDSASVVIDLSPPGKKPKYQMHKLY